MITLSNITFCNSRNEIYLFHQGNLEFKENTLYFIIGRSGHGKTSIIDFLTSPFTEDPIKNGTIKISGTEHGLENKTFSIINSHSVAAKSYYNFIRTHVAFIPQKIDSFHPKISVSEQMFDMYRTALNRGRIIRQNRVIEADWENFKNSISYYSKYAGWDNVSVFGDYKSKEKSLFITEKIGYMDADNKKFENSVPENTVNNSHKIWQHEFSSGQIQRMLILNGFLQYSVMENPILIADEFLVNFSYQEANKVLENIISLFSQSPSVAFQGSKTGIFILHDLSYPALQKIPSGINVNLIVLEKKSCKEDNRKRDTKYSGKLFFHEIPLSDFFLAKWENEKMEAVFEPFLKSYCHEPIKNCSISVKKNESSIYNKIEIKESPAGRPAGLYAGKSGTFEIPIRKNKFIVITGFSGVGKSTLCEQILRDLLEKGMINFRYLPASLLSSLSEDSYSTVYQDLSQMYGLYNGINDIRQKEIQNKVMLQAKVTHLLEDEYSSVSFNDFMNWHIYDLSGGQQQRYWLTRLLLDYFPDENHIQPELLVFDENIASLDCQTKNSLIKMILEDYFSKKGYTIMLISHDRRDISVIYRTLKENLTNDTITESFEHYELFGGMLYRVNTPYPDFIQNQDHGLANTYESCQIKAKSRHFILPVNSSGGKENYD